MRGLEAIEALHLVGSELNTEIELGTRALNRNLWLPFLSVLLALMLCACVLVCSASGLLLFKSVDMENSLASMAPSAPPALAMVGAERLPSSQPGLTAG